jgi:hypothetical protein
MRVSKINRMKAAISAAFVLLTVIGTAGCGEGTAAVGTAARAAAHDAEQSALRATIHDVAKALDSEEARVVLGTACQALGLASPSEPSSNVDLNEVSQVKEALYEEQLKGAQGAQAVVNLCQAI